MAEGTDQESVDRTLFEAWRAGDTQAGTQLFERHFDALFRFFRHKTDEGAEDLVQQTFLSVLGGPAFRAESSFRSYLFAVARNTLYAHWKRRRKSENETDIAGACVADLDPSPSAVLAKRREERLILEGLRRIPLELQIALELYYFEELSGPELASVLGVPEGTVRSRLRRAREALDRAIAKLTDDRVLLESTTTDLDSWAERVRGLTPELG
ncbi:MAG: RNA polymerase sigma factor [Polyangiaceae bacterium]